MKDDEEIVDAMRHPLAGDRCPACGAVLPPTGIGCGECAWMGEPLPDDAVRAPDTQAEADAAPLTHALDAEGNALCPYDGTKLAYVSPRHERVTCPTCREATAEPAPARSLWSVAAEMQGEPAGHRVAALLRAMDDAAKDAVEETDDRPDHVRTGRPFAYVEGLHEATRLIREHLGAPSPEDFAKLPRLSDAEIQTALNKGRSEAFPAHHPFAAHLAAPSPLDLAVGEVCAVPPVKINDGPFGIEIDALNTITDLAMKSGHGEPREWLLKIAHVALRALACDTKGGSK